jgi:hypothetical protein
LIWSKALTLADKSATIILRKVIFIARSALRSPSAIIACSESMLIAARKI